MTIKEAIQLYNMSSNKKGRITRYAKYGNGYVLIPATGMVKNVGDRPFYVTEDGKVQCYTIEMELNKNSPKSEDYKMVPLI